MIIEVDEKTNEEVARCVQEAGEKDLENFQMGIVMLKNLRPIMAKYGLAGKADQDAKLKEENAAARTATLMQFCPAAESADVLYVDESGGKYDALMSKHSGY